MDPASPRMLLLSRKTSRSSKIPRGGGGGHSTSQLDRGVPLGGVKTWPCHIALGARKIHPVIICLTKNIQMHTLLQYCTPRIYPVWLGMLRWQAKRKKKKERQKKGHRLRLDRGPVIKHYGARDPVINEGRFWYPVSMVMTTLGRFDTLCQYRWPAKSYPVQRHVPITFHNGGAPPPPPG